jgi:hypothetical protein
MHIFYCSSFSVPCVLHNCRQHCPAKICQMKDTCSIATPPSLLASLNLQMVIRKASLPWPDRMPPHALDLKMIWWPSWSDPLPACKRILAPTHGGTALTCFGEVPIQAVVLGRRCRCHFLLLFSSIAGCLLLLSNPWCLFVALSLIPSCQCNPCNACCPHRPSNSTYATCGTRCLFRCCACLLILPSRGRLLFPVRCPGPSFRLPNRQLLQLNAPRSRPGRSALESSWHQEQAHHSKDCGGEQDGKQKQREGPCRKHNHRSAQRAGLHDPEQLLKGGPNARHDEEDKLIATSDNVIRSGS